MKVLLLAVGVIMGCGYHIGTLYKMHISLKPPTNSTEHRGIEVELYRLVIEEIRKTPGLVLDSDGIETSFDVYKCYGLPIYDVEGSPVVGDLYIEIRLRIKGRKGVLEKRLSTRQRYDERRGITVEDSKQEALRRLAQSVALELLIPEE